MMQYVSMRDICVRLLTPNDTLDVAIFDFRQMMYPDIRSKLIKMVNVVINKSIGYIPGLKIEDVCLRGSTAGYNYHKNSDLDIQIFIQNYDCDFLTKDKEGLYRFMTHMQTASLPNQQFFLNNRFVDIKFATAQNEIMGLYSILNNKWLVYPNKALLTALDVDDIMQEYTKRYYEIKDHLKQIVQTQEIFTLQGIKNLEIYYANMYKLSWTSAREFVIFKLITQRGVVSDIKKLLCDAISKTLSIV